MGRPPNPEPASPPMPWESPAIATQVQEILDALEVPAIDAETRKAFQRTLYRQKYFPSEDARGKIILTLRCILESSGNEDAIGEPIIVSAVAGCLQPKFVDRGLALVEAFDRIPLVSLLQTLRELFGDNVGQHLPTVIRNKLYSILEPAEAKPAAKVKLPPKPPRAVTRIPAIENKIALGLQLLDLKSNAIGNIEFGRLRRKLGVEPVRAQEALRVAGIYGRRPEIFRRLTWQALVELSSPRCRRTPGPNSRRRSLPAVVLSTPKFEHAGRSRSRRRGWRLSQ